MNVRVLGKMLAAEGKCWSCCIKMFYIAPVADAEDKLCRLVSEVGRVCERK